MVAKPFKKPVWSTSRSLRWGATTPRPATVEPIGYHELQLLLAALTDLHHRGGGFDPHRLRELLDLP
jgi:hypothetical protein